MSLTTAAYSKAKRLLIEGVIDNPLVAQELRTRMRDWKAFGAMGAYVLLVAGIQFVAYVAISNSCCVSLPLTLLTGGRKLGMEIFLHLVWTQAILLMLIIPSITFSSLAQEIERETMEMLALTRLTSSKIVVGKQLAGLLYALVLLISTVSLASMCLMLGGISPAEIGVWYLVLVAWCFLLTCVVAFSGPLFLQKRSPRPFLRTGRRYCTSS
ncbi:MAG: ABC transporter permease [Armatimonadetes bacterium]|nr:ABC transporter permease [Armatimonadota bacterium]